MWVFETLKSTVAVRVGGCWLLLVWLLAAVAGAEELYAPPEPSDVRTQALAWVAEQAVTEQKLLEQAGKLWAFGDEAFSADELLETVVQTFALLDADTRALVEACRLDDASLVPPDAAVLERAGAGDFYRANMRLFYATSLTQRRMYDEALDVFEELDPKQVVDPAGCLFFRAVCEHKLLKKEAGLATLQKLLKNTEDVPVRYTTVAKLMEYDFQSMREKSLDEIARQMSDVERRLALGRGGQRVQKVEDEIIATLDEIIKKIEQQQGGGGGGNSGGNKNQSSSPAQDSVVKGSTAPGEVDKKQIGNESGWGSLPPKDAAKAKNLINRQFPAHYRQAIEQYFKKSANRPAFNPKP